MVLQMIQDLMIKGKDEFLEHFARLGVFSKVAALAGPQEATPEPEAESNQLGEEQRMEDAKELSVGRAYHWRDWCICRGRDCLYIWSDAAALELSNGSNGWFRFILDGKLATMYSSGSPEGGTDTTGKHSLPPSQNTSPEETLVRSGTGYHVESSRTPRCHQSSIHRSILLSSLITLFFFFSTRSVSCFFVHPPTSSSFSVSLSGGRI